MRRIIRAGFISDQTIQSIERALAKLLKAKIPSGEYGAYEAMRNIEEFLKSVEKTIISAGVHHFAERGIQSIIRPLVEEIEARISGHQKARGLSNKYWRTPFRSVQDYMEYRIASAMEQTASKANTLEKMLAVELVVDESKIPQLAAKLLKKATPEELEALALSMNDRDFLHGRAMEVEGKYSSRVNLLAKAQKLVEKVKHQILIPIQSIFRLYAGETNAHTKFDLHGMKVLVSDPEMTMRTIHSYVKYLDEAYERLRAKGLQKVWYGEVYLQCEKCGGVNYLTGGGVGGSYNIRQNIVQVFVRPGPQVVQLMAHELGHRFWYKGMTESQRQRFESLVKVHRRLQPSLEIPKPLSNTFIDGLLEKFSPLMELLRAAQDDWETFKKGKIRFENTLYTLLEAGKTPRGRPENPHWKEANGWVTTLVPSLEETRQEVIEEGPGALHRLVREAEEGKDKLARILQKAKDEDDALIKAMDAKGKDEEWMAEYQADPRPVFPVSSYGTMNISEAFAEVFAHYVMNKDMTRDQLESFRSVIRTASDLTALTNAVAVHIARVQMFTDEFEGIIHEGSPRALESLVRRQAEVLGVPVDARQEARTLLSEAARSRFPRDIWEQWVRDLRRIG